MDNDNFINEYHVNITKTIGYNDSISQDDTFDDITNTHINNSSMLYIKDNIATSKSKLLNLHMCLASCERLKLKTQLVLTIFRQNL